MARDNIPLTRSRSLEKKDQADDLEESELQAMPNHFSVFEKKLNERLYNDRQRQMNENFTLTKEVRKISENNSQLSELLRIQIEIQKANNENSTKQNEAIINAIDNLAKNVVKNTPSVDEEPVVNNAEENNTNNFNPISRSSSINDSLEQCIRDNRANQHRDLDMGEKIAEAAAVVGDTENANNENVASWADEVEAECATKCASSEKLKHMQLEQVNIKAQLEQMKINFASLVENNLYNHNRLMQHTIKNTMDLQYNRELLIQSNSILCISKEEIPEVDTRMDAKLLNSPEKETKNTKK